MCMCVYGGGGGVNVSKQASCTAAGRANALQSLKRCSFLKIMMLDKLQNVRIKHGTHLQSIYLKRYSRKMINKTCIITQREGQAKGRHQAHRQTDTWP